MVTRLGPWCALALALLVGLAAHPAAAQPGKAEFEKAAKYFQAEEYELALPYFQKAYELSGGRASAALALAQCERQLKRYDEALRHFAEYLEKAPNAEDRAKVEETIELVKELKARDASLAPKSPPETKSPPESKSPPEIQSPPKSPEPGPKSPPAAKSPEPGPKAAPTIPTPEPGPRPAPAPGADLAAPPPAEAEDGSIFASPIFWIVAGAVVASGAAVGIGVAVGGGERDPYGGTSNVIIRP